MKRVLSNAWENDYERAYLQHIVLVLVGRETPGGMDPVSRLLSEAGGSPRKRIVIIRS